MDRIDVLISGSRLDTDNEDFDDTSGIPDDAFIRWINRAQERIQAKILALKPRPNVFQKTLEVSATANEESYAIPSNVFLSTRVELLEYSHTGLAKDFYPLTLSTQMERLPGENAGQPSRYFRQSNRVVVMPKPGSSAAKLRWTYQYGLPKLDFRRGAVSAVTLSTTQLTALTLDVTLLTDDNITAITNKGYISLVDEFGNIQMKGIPVASIDSTTGIVAIVGGAFTFEDGETAAIGNYAVAGAYATSHSPLPDTCERYLSIFLDWKAFKKDSNQSAVEASQELQETEADILDSFLTAEADVQGIPIIDTEYF
jgi:hypothetical protein